MKFKIFFLLFLFILIFISCSDNGKYYCHSGGGCIESSIGEFNSIEDCENNCSCNFVLYEGNGPNCGNGSVVVSSSICCDENTAYYCSVTGICYATCQAAENACNNVQVIKGHFSDGGGDDCVNQPTYQNQLAVDAYFTNGCGNGNDMSIDITNNSGIELEIRVGIKRNDGTWSCGIQSAMPNAVKNFWSCNNEGSYIVEAIDASIWLSQCNFSEVFPSSICN